MADIRGEILVSLWAEQAWEKLGFSNPKKWPPLLWKKKITFGWKFAPMGGIGLFNILTRKQDQVPMVS